MKETVCVSVENIALAREKRSDTVRALFYKSRCSAVIQFTLNIPGNVKNSPLYIKIFRAGAVEIKLRFKAAGLLEGVNYSHTEYEDLFTGPEAYFVFPDKDPSALKAETSLIEKNHPLGRIFDIDVFSSPGDKLSDSERGLRRCFICSEPAFACAKKGAHTFESLIEYIRITADNYFTVMSHPEKSRIAWKISDLACRAMLCEAAASPKPGLVDRYNNGAHNDMDFFTFIKSSSALAETFYSITEVSASFTGDNPEELLEKLKVIGLDGEKKMYSATGGINTQKGLIFSLGLLCAAAGYLLARGEKTITTDTVCSLAGRIIKKSVEADLAALADLNACAGCESKPGRAGRAGRSRHALLTSGEKLYISHGIKGARGEAAAGFPSALKAYNRITALLESGKDFNKSLVQTLMHIMAETEDTNIPGRKDFKTLEYVKAAASDYLGSGGVFNDPEMRKCKALDRDFTDQGISPGGCADILALGIFLYFAETELFGAQAPTL